MTAVSDTTSTWRCPDCDYCVVAIAVEVGHNCPARKRRWVAFRRIDEHQAAAS